MKKEIKNKYADADKYLQPVCDPMSRQEYLDCLETGIRRIFSEKEDQMKVFLFHLRILKACLEKHAIATVVPDETYYDQVLAWMIADAEYNGKEYSIHSRKKVSRDMRQVVNKYFLPNGIVQRKVLLEVEIDRYRRFWRLSQQSQRAIVWFEKNGKEVHGKPTYGNSGVNASNVIAAGAQVIKYTYFITNKELLPRTKDAKILAAMRALEYTGRNAFEDFTETDWNKFVEQCHAGGFKKNRIEHEEKE